ncbi:2-dehydropantoate 2-reductase [Caballeronia sp. LP003]|uniref:ketopantoate reductase family protein n=1 Tax=Caballeronia sp. LP003 TaxID=3038551 RepID=UPI00285A92D4|nr:2-dehydropantoate 2-reductase [Caballeronia sp. LP003]MDR5785450.1 2-dehydropantoate 2-reductase [Caballeronia sp. LP003]
MKIAIMGTGGVRGYFGAKLAKGGNEVSFIARGEHLDAIKARGLTVKSPLGDMHVTAPRATDRPSEIGPVDVVLFGVKLWDTKAAIDAIGPLIGPETVVISLQNGVVEDELLRAALGKGHVAGGVCYSAATLQAPGVIEHANNLQKLVFGEYDGRRSARLEHFYRACIHSGIDAAISDDIACAIWEKFVFLVGLLGSTATTRCSIGEVRKNPASRRLLECMMQETVNVGRAEGVNLAADFALDRLVFCDQLPEDMTASMSRDLERGNRLELRG